MAGSIASFSASRAPVSSTEPNRPVSTGSASPTRLIGTAQRRIRSIHSGRATRSAAAKIPGRSPRRICCQAPSGPRSRQIITSPTVNSRQTTGRRICSDCSFCLPRKRWKTVKVTMTSRGGRSAAGRPSSGFNPCRTCIPALAEKKASRAKSAIRIRARPSTGRETGCFFCTIPLLRILIDDLERHVADRKDRAVGQQIRGTGRLSAGGRPSSHWCCSNPPPTRPAHPNANRHDAWKHTNYPGECRYLYQRPDGFLAVNRNRNPPGSASRCPRRSPAAGRTGSISPFFPCARPATFRGKRQRAGAAEPRKTGQWRPTW